MAFKIKIEAISGCFIPFQNSSALSETPYTYLAGYPTKASKYEYLPKTIKAQHQSTLIRSISFLIWCLPSQHVSVRCFYSSRASRKLLLRLIEQSVVLAYDKERKYQSCNPNSNEISLYELQQSRHVGVGNNAMDQISQNNNITK